MKSAVQSNESRWRTRRRHLTLALGTIAVGLALHQGGGALPSRVRDALGDALWAVMIVWWTGVVAPSVALRTRGLAAFAVCVAVETSQRYHTPMLDAVRRTLPGHLVLGSGFDPRDFVSYAGGVIVALLLARVLPWLNQPTRVKGEGDTSRVKGEGKREKGEIRKTP